MIFESKNGKLFKGFPLTEFRYKLKINESCYAVRMVLYNEEEYILSQCKSIKEAKIRCDRYNKIFKTKTHFIKVTRVSDTKYEYESCNDSGKLQPGTPYGSFNQSGNAIEEIDDYTIGGRYIYNKSYLKDKEKPDDFTIGASYCAEECIPDDPMLNDEFTIGASYASSDFYDYNKKKCGY